MRVKVVYLGSIRQKVGIKKEDLSLADGSSLIDLLNKIVIAHNMLKDIIRIEDENLVDPNFVVLLNGLSINLEKMKETRLKDGDTVTLMTPISGGDPFKPEVNLKTINFSQN